MNTILQTAKKDDLGNIKRMSFVAEGFILINYYANVTVK